MGTKSTISYKKLSEEYLNSQSTHWMYCPYCYSIPSIKQFLKKGELYISIYCKCLYDKKETMTFDDYEKLIMKSKVQGVCKKHSNTEGFLFCITCEKWLCNLCYISHKKKYSNHLFNKIPIRLKEYCYRHEKELAVAYCKICSKNVCEDCKIEKEKLRHELFIYYDKENVVRCNNKWNDFIQLHMTFNSRNEKNKEEIIGLIKKSNDISDDDKNNLINKINSSYIKNKQINDKICEYILFLYSNFNYSYDIGKIVNRNIFYNINSLRLDHTTFSIKEELSVIKNAEALIKYYENIHILQSSHLVNIKNISTERQNVTKQISKACLLDNTNVATLTSKGIIIVWDYIDYNELYRIKKLTFNENTYLEKKDNNILKNTNTINDIHNYIIPDLNDDDNNLNINERVIRQQAHILNLIRNNTFNQKNIKKLNIIKVYTMNNLSKLNSSNNSNGDGQNYDDTYNQNEINNMNKDLYHDEEEDALDLNFNFSSMAFIKKFKILCLIIDNCSDIYLFDITKKEALKERLIGHKKEVLDILTLKNNNLASYGKDYAIRIWNLNKFQNTMTINVEIKKYYIYFTQLLYGNLIFATDKSLIKILKLPEYEFDNDITCVSQPINYFELPDKRLIIASDDYYVKVLKPPDYKQVLFLFHKKRIKIYSFLLLDKNRLLVGLSDNCIHLINFNSKSHKNDILISTHLSPIGSLIKTNDINNTKVISMSWDNAVKVFLVGD